MGKLELYIHFINISYFQIFPILRMMYDVLIKVNLNFDNIIKNKMRESVLFPTKQNFSKEKRVNVILTFRKRDIYETQNIFFNMFLVFGEQSLRFILQPSS